jgi:predicted FMN-binding regulatory protein PaiB
MRNGKDTSVSVVAIKGGASIVTLVDEVSAASDMCALPAVFERSKIDLAIAMHLAKENRKDDFGGVAKGE